MPNGKYILDELEFEAKIAALPDRDLLELVARQNYTTSIKCIEYEKRIGILETGARKISSIAGGIAGVITAVIVGIANYFATRG